MPRRIAAVALITILLLLVSSAGAQESQPSQSEWQQSQGAMAGMASGEMQQKTEAKSDAGRAAMNAMSDSMHMSGNMDRHMFMTSLRPKSAGDDERAAEIVKTARESIEKYKDYRVALADGYRIFLPHVPQKHYHFTNYWNAFKARFTFDPAHPTSLPYKKVKGTYVLEGAMFTAPKNFTDDQLNERVPLSVARWHKHVNLCLPPRGEKMQDVNWKEFGADGSIATKQACREADGRWIPQIFCWMVHVYPYETDSAKIWAH